MRRIVMKLEMSFAPKAFESPTKTRFHRLANLAGWVALVVGATSLCQGWVIVPVRAPTRTNALAGNIEKVNLDLLQAAKSTRPEVTERVSETDTTNKDKWRF